MQIGVTLTAITRALSVFGVWGWLDLFGAALVAVGCAGEFCVLLNKIPEHNERRPNLKGFWRVVNCQESSIKPTLVRLRIVRRRPISALQEHLLECGFLLMVALGVGMEWLSLPFSAWEVVKAGENAADARNAAGKANKQAGIANKLAGEANERAALTESNNLVLRSNVFALELKMLEASNAIVKMDLVKRPLWSVVAFVSLRYKTDDAVPTDFDLATSNLPPVMELHGKYVFGPSIRLLPDRHFDSFPKGALFADGTARKPNNWAMVMELSWHPYFMNTNIVSTNRNEMEEWLSTAEHWPAAQFSESIVDFEFFPRLPYKTEILSGRIEVIYNWSMWQEFTIPPQWVGWPPGIGRRPHGDLAAIRDQFSSGQVLKDRSISPERKKQIVDKLRDVVKPLQVTMCFEPIEGGEPERFAEILKQTLADAGYAVSTPINSLPCGTRSVPTGISIISNQPRLHPVGAPGVETALAEALSDAGIFSTVGWTTGQNVSNDIIMSIHVFGAP